MNFTCARSRFKFFVVKAAVLTNPLLAFKMFPTWVFIKQHVCIFMYGNATNTINLTPPPQPLWKMGRNSWRKVIFHPPRWWSCCSIFILVAQQQQVNLFCSLPEACCCYFLHPTFTPAQQVVQRKRGRSSTGMGRLASRQNVRAYDDANSPHWGLLRRKVRDWSTGKCRSINLPE